jgi:hypothetical protein
VPGDVLKEYPSGADFSNDAGDVGPEVPLVILAASLSCHAERLTGVACKDGVDCPLEGPSVKGGEVGPDRGGREVSGPLGGDEDGTRPVLPFDEGAGVIAGLGEHEAQIKASAACAEGQSVPGT